MPWSVWSYHVPGAVCFNLSCSVCMMLLPVLAFCWTLWVTHMLPGYATSVCTAKRHSTWQTAALQSQTLQVVSDYARYTVESCTGTHSCPRPHPSPCLKSPSPPRPRNIFGFCPRPHPIPTAVFPIPIPSPQVSSSPSPPPSPATVINTVTCTFSLLHCFFFSFSIGPGARMLIKLISVWVSSILTMSHCATDE